MAFIEFSEIVEENGKTIRENNMEKTHQIPLGTLVEVSESGIRLFVCSQGRDCDGTPLYGLSADQDFRPPGPFRESEYFVEWDDTQSRILAVAAYYSQRGKESFGYPEESLKVVECATSG